MYRSNFEKKFAKSLKDNGIRFKYENLHFKYTVERTYTPDFDLGDFIVETKGRFTSSDRAKHLRIKEAYPKADIRFVFMNPRVKLNKKSQTTYGDWCDKHGFKWADSCLPKEWLSKKKRKR